MLHPTSHFPCSQCHLSGYPELLSMHSPPVSQETKNTHHSLVTCNGLRPGWEGHCSRHRLEDSIVSCIFFFRLCLHSPFLYCNLKFVLLLIHCWICLLFASQSCCPTFEKSVPLSGWVPAWVQPSPSFWATAAPGGSVATGEELILGRFHIGPFTSRRSLRQLEPDRISSVHVVIWLSSSIWMITLDFFPTLLTDNSSFFFFFFSPSLVLGVFSTKSFCVNEAGWYWGQLYRHGLL